MVSRKRDHQIRPAGLLSEGCKKKQIEALLEGSAHSFDPYYYRHDTVIASLKDIYDSKCAYCESNLLATGCLRIDHYRPKNKIKEEDHTGYYWLGYEWSNLLPACDRCNGSKSNHFPISGTRITSVQNDEREFLVDSQSFTNEAPLLIHPEVDHPEMHVGFSPNGKVKALSDKGGATIRICKLNREELVLMRKKTVDDFLSKLTEAFADFLDQSINVRTFKYTLRKIFKELKSLSDPKEPYSRFNFSMTNRYYQENLF